MGIDLNESILQFIKVAAIFFALFHLLVGFVLVQRVTRMNNIMHTKRSGMITFLNFLYIAVLIFIIALIILL